LILRKFTSHVGEYAGKYVKNEYYNPGEAPERLLMLRGLHSFEKTEAFKVGEICPYYPP
jgi:isoleucyl-tRNA synthetase